MRQCEVEAGLHQSCLSNQNRSVKSKQAQLAQAMSSTQTILWLSPAQLKGAVKLIHMVPNKNGRLLQAQQLQGTQVVWIQHCLHFEQLGTSNCSELLLFAMTTSQPSYSFEAIEATAPWI